MFKYENNMLLLCETINVFIDASCYSNILLHQLELFKLIKLTLKSLHVLWSLSAV